MKRAGHGVQVLSALSTMAVCIVCFAFVDDADTVQTAHSVDQSGEEVLQQFQPAVDRWEGLLRATGGAIEPSKSWWVLIDFVWDAPSHEFKYRSIEDMPGELTVKDHTGTQRILKRIEVEDSNNQPTLGVRLTMTGDLTDQLYHLAQEAETFAFQLQQTRADKKAVFYTYQSSFMKTIEYPLTATTFTEAQWNSIMAPVIKTVLQKSGFSATFPRDIFFGPVKYQGFGCKHPYYHQEMLHVVTLVNEILNTTQTGQLLIVSLEELVRDLGVAEPLHRVPYRTYVPCTKNSWITTLWRFVNYHSISIDGLIEIPPLLRNNDTYLVSRFVQCGYSGKDLKVLNQIRQTLHAFTISDLATADGKQISVDAWQAEGSNNLRDEVQWPRKIPISHASLRLWQVALRKCFLNQYSPPTSRTLVNPLGLWKHLSIRRCWRWWFSEAEDRIYRQDGAMWSVFTRVGGRRRNTFIYDHTTWTKPLSANLLASVVCQGVRFWLNSFSPVHLDIPPSESETGIPLPDILTRWVADPRYLLERVQIPTDAGARLAGGIIQGTARAVSDGSYKPGIVGTAACLLAADGQDKDCLKALNLVPGWADDQSPYRSELTGIVGSLTLILALCHSFDIQEGSVTLALDGEAAMKQAMVQADKNIPLKVTQKHFDLLQVCRSLLRKLPVRIKWRWVESHQREKGVVSLDWWAQMNDWCDHNAKIFGKHCHTYPMVPRTKLFGETVVISVDGNKMSHTSVDDLYCRTYGKKTLAYWRKRREHT